MRYPQYKEPGETIINDIHLLAPPDDGSEVKLVKGPNIKTLPKFEPFEENAAAPVLLKMEDNISTDEILRAGAEVLPFRSNIPEISKWSYYIIDPNFYDRAMNLKDQGKRHIVVAGDNYAQGSSREHAALAPRFLGQIAVIAKSYARIGWQNLVNFGIVPLEFEDPEVYDAIDQEDVISLKGVKKELEAGKQTFELTNATKGKKFKVSHSMSDRQRQVVLVGGVINYFKMKNE
jgi:aconitate hydratase